MLFPQYGQVETCPIFLNTHLWSHLYLKPILLLYFNLICYILYRFVNNNQGNYGFPHFTFACF